jgi:hypothetical protein
METLARFDERSLDRAIPSFRVNVKGDGAEDISGALGTARLLTDTGSDTGDGETSKSDPTAILDPTLSDSTGKFGKTASSFGRSKGVSNRLLGMGKTGGTTAGVDEAAPSNSIARDWPYSDANGVLGVLRD